MACSHGSVHESFSSSRNAREQKFLRHPIDAIAGQRDIALEIVEHRLPFLEQPDRFRVAG